VKSNVAERASDAMMVQAHVDAGGHSDDVLKSLLAQTDTEDIRAEDVLASGGVLHSGHRLREQAMERRRASSQLRMTATDKLFFGPRDAEAEKQWQETVRQRKTMERRRREFEAAKKVAEEAAPDLREATSPLHPALLSPMAAARASWKAEDRARQREHEKAAQATHREKERVLDEEWAPLFAQHREQARIKREEEAAAQRDANEAILCMQRWEVDAMAREDADSAAFARSAEAECRRREELPLPANVLAAREVFVAEYIAEQKRLQEQELKRKELEAARLAQLEASKDKEYREWKEQLRKARCWQKNMQQQGSSDPLCGRAERLRQQPPTRDILREHDLESKTALEATHRSAEIAAIQLRACGGSPRRRLEQARAIADEQKRVRDAKEPERQEQELWETMLAKNRFAKQRERNSLAPRTPRWGSLCSGA